MLSFGILTLGVSSLVRIFHFDPNILRIMAVVVIGFMGLTLFIPSLAGLIESAVSRISGLFPQSNTNSRGFGPGLVTGLALGVVWTPCAGPILAAIASLSTLGLVNINVVLITAAYVTGIGIPLFIFAYSGQQIIAGTKLFSKRTRQVQQGFGVIMILTAAAIYTNFDTYLQAQLLNAFPWFNTTINAFESNSTINKQLEILQGRVPVTQQPADPNGVLNSNYPAPEISGISNWLNLPAGGQVPTINNLKGHVVLIDFWTYTCINCVRTLPFTTSWYNKYKEQGLVIIGVHTPEFQFEHDTVNVQAAIKMYGITYPVAQDNNYTTWNNFDNQYWPAEYLIDVNGTVRRTHFGEGEYDKTETAIQTLLKDAGKQVNSSLVNIPDQTPTTQISPETYLGTDRMEYYYPSGNTGNGNRTFTLNENPPQDSFSLGGNWDISGGNATAGNNATLVYHFTAGKVYLVMQPGKNGADKVKVLLDGKETSEITVNSDRLYTLIDLGKNSGTHILKLEFENPGTEVYAFTFG
jgi:cytochrome c biogenesis protein CcdA/thiol-disulfide isomerase/thioredoxin